MKTAKWREHWNKLTKDPATGQPFRYLAIKGWEEYQEDEYTSIWIKDYLAKDENPGFYMLPVMQQWMMDRLRRMRAVRRQNLDNNPEGLLTAFRLSNRRAEWAQGPSNLLALVEQGFLVPTNQQDKKSTRVYKRKNKNNNNGVVDQETDKADTPSPVPPVKPETPSPDNAVGGNGSPPPAKHVRPVASVYDWQEDLAGYSAERIRSAIRYHMERNTNHYYADRMGPRFLRANIKKVMDDVPQAWWDDPDGYGAHRKKPPGKYRWEIDAETDVEHKKVMEEVEQQLDLLGCETCGGKHTIKSGFSNQLDVPCPECKRQRQRILDEAVEKGQLKIVKLLTGNSNAVRYARVKKETVNA